MSCIAVKEVLDQLPVAELEESMATFLEPMMEKLPDERLKRVVLLSVGGILGSESPIVTRMAQAVARDERSVWATAKRLYGFLSNERFDHQELNQGLAAISRASIEAADPDYAVVVIDPVNFEKPYTEKLEGVSTVLKSTPPDLKGQKRLAHGYPSITATVVNTPVPATLYANWFSYTTAFVSENDEIGKAIVATQQQLPHYRRRYVLDAAFDDKQWFEQLAQEEFVIRVSHLERIVEVYNERLERWEEETVGDLVDLVLFTHTFQVTFTHARRLRLAEVQIGWYPIRLPQTQQPLWLLVAYDVDKDRTLVLLTSIPLQTIADVRAVYNDWRLRARVEHGYRFDQEQGLDVEDMRVQTLERMRRLFLLVLAAAQFVFYLIDTWPAAAVQWIRRLGGKLELDNDLDGPYLVLRGLAAIFQTVATLTFASLSPFPHHLFTYG